VLAVACGEKSKAYAGKTCKLGIDGNINKFKDAKTQKDVIITTLGCRNNLE
jgi:hypothetical protein